MNDDDKARDDKIRFYMVPLTITNTSSTHALMLKDLMFSSTETSELYMYTYRTKFHFLLILIFHISHIDFPITASVRVNIKSLCYLLRLD
jgi:hypothetical protein